MQSIIDTMITRLVQDLSINIEILQIAHEVKSINKAQDIINAAREEAEERKDEILDTLRQSSLEFRSVYLETDGIWDTHPCLIVNLNNQNFVGCYSARMNLQVHVSSVTNVRFTNHTDNTSQLEGII